MTSYAAGSTCYWHEKNVGPTCKESNELTPGFLQREVDDRFTNSMITIIEDGYYIVHYFTIKGREEHQLFGWTIRLQRCCDYE